MGNSSTSHLPAYRSCEDANISGNSITPEYWDTASISQDFRMSSLAVATILLLFLVIGLPSNVILIVSIISKHLYREPTHILLLNLAIADLLVCLLFMPFGIVSGYAGSFVFGNSDKMRCQVCQFGLVYTALSVASLNILGLISIDRFVFIKYPLHYGRYITTTTTVLAIAFVWFYSAAQSVLPLFGFGQIRYTYSACMCQLYLDGSTNLTKNIYYVVLLVLLGLIPVAVMIVSNTWIIVIVNVHIKKLYVIRRSLGNRRQLRNHQLSIRKEVTKSKNRKQLGVLRAFGMIFIANLITWLPLILLTVFSFTVDETSIPIVIYVLVFLSFISHSILHPIIEGCFIPELRTSFKKIVCSCKDKCLRKNIKDSVTHRSTASINISLGGTVDNGDAGWSSRSCRSCLDLCNFALLPESQEMENAIEMVQTDIATV